MTRIRHPNRRPIPGVADLVHGCPSTGKIRYVDARSAQLARDLVARNDPDGERLEVYPHAACGDWHIGHRAATAGVGR